MRRIAVVIAAATVGLMLESALAAPAPSSGRQPPPATAPEPTHRAKVLTRRIHDDEAKLRTEQDPAERQRLLDDIEQCKHELGPRDADGQPVHCQAMWHQAALNDLDADIKRLRARKTATPGPVADARLAIRQMASACLLRGWTWGGTLPRYQFDAFGQYLYNNLALLDGMIDMAASWLAKEAAPPVAPGPDRDAMLKAIGEIKDAVGRMAKAIEDFENTDARTVRGRDVMMAALPEFVDALRAVYEANLVLADLGEKLKKGGSAAGPAPTAPLPAASPAEATAPASEAATPTLSADEKAALEKIRTVAASLEGPGWQPIRDALERFSAVAEQGLQVPSARPGAQELLHCLARTADYVAGLLKSRSAYPEYIARHQESLATAFTYMADRRERQHAYTSLRRICDGGHDRKVLDASPLSDAAAQGILRARSISYSAFTGPNASQHSTQFVYGLDAIIDILDKMRSWPPKDMAGQLQPLYKRCAEVFLQSAEAFGKMPQTDLDALWPAASTAGTYARDLERLVKADQAIKAVAQYVPARAAPMYADLVKRVEGLIENTSKEKMQERTNLDYLFRPFQELADLQLPEADHGRIVTAIAGGALKTALANLNRQITAGLTDAAKGNSTALDEALDARYMFRLLRRRAVAETLGLAKLGMANLEGFSAPEKTWKDFIAVLDEHLRRMIVQYAKQPVPPRGQYRSWGSVWIWETCFNAIAAAQSQTAGARVPGETDLAMLLRHLDRVADPAPPDSASLGWIVGYHATEAAVSVAAGFEGTARWHLNEIRYARDTTGYQTPFTSEVFDPRK